MKLAQIGLLIGLLIFTATTFAMDDNIAKADQFWKNRSDKKMVELAISTLESVVTKDATNYDALWRLGRYYQFLGDNTSDKKMKLQYYEKGLTDAEQAVTVNSNGPDGHLQYAILLGCVSLEKSLFEGLITVQTIRKELNIALSLDPLNGRIHNTLALFYWKVPGHPISFGNKKKAQEEAALAVKYDPSVVYYWLVYGQIADVNKDYSTARMALSKVLELPDDLEDPNDVNYKNYASKELMKLPMA